MPARIFKITYNSNLEIEIVACSKYDAKLHFYRLYPRAKIISIEEVKV
jgi:hypothetical protein